VASWKEIELGRHGIVLEKDGKAALFLPQVPEQLGWDRRQTLSALAEKAGLPRNAWRKDAAFSVFTGQVFRENE
jgi:AMMECR1 domain-containing protein